MTVGQMMTFLSVTGFISDWIENYAVKMAPLKVLISEAGVKMLNAPLRWTSDALVATEIMKQELQTAPVLATPDYSKPFSLVCC